MPELGSGGVHRRAVAQGHLGTPVGHLDTPVGHLDLCQQSCCQIKGVGLWDGNAVGLWDGNAVGLGSTGAKEPWLGCGAMGL